MGHLMNALRIATIPGSYVMNSLPSVSFATGRQSFFLNPLVSNQGLIISLLTSTFLTILQTILLRIPAIRLALKIPIVPVELQGKLPRFRDTFQMIRNYFTSGVNGRLDKDLKERVDKARREAMAKERMNRARRR